MSTTASSYSGLTVVSNWKFPSIITSMHDIGKHTMQLDILRSPSHVVNVDLHSQIRARLRRFKPCLQVNIALEGCKIDHKATLAAFSTWGLRGYETRIVSEIQCQCAHDDNAEQCTTP